MNNKLNIDKAVKEKLDDFSVAPPAHIWGNIQSNMAAQQRKKRLVYVSWIAAAAVVVFAFIAGWMFNHKAGEISTQTAEQTITAPAEEDTNVESENINQEIRIEDALMAESKEKEEINTNVGNTELNRALLLNEEQSASSLVAIVERVSYNLMESIEAILIQGDHTVYLAEYKPENNQAEFTDYDKMLIAENIKNTNKPEDRERGWKLGANVSPGYSSHSTNHSEQYAQNMSYSASSGSSNLGGGFSVQYKTSKRLRVESGVYYSQNGQSSETSNRELVSFNGNTDYMYAAPEARADVAPGFSNKVQLSSSGMAMNSTAGVVKMESTPRGSMITTKAESPNAQNTNTLTTSGEFSQVFQFVEVPLYLRYIVLDKRFGIDIMGGLNAGIVVGNDAYINNEYGKQNIGSTEDISTMNVSGTVGVGMSYALGKHVSLALEPRFNYFLNSINSNPDVDFRPYRVGLFTGIYYEF